MRKFLLDIVRTVSKLAKFTLKLVSTTKSRLPSIFEIHFLQKNVETSLKFVKLNILEYKHKIYKSSVAGCGSRIRDTIYPVKKPKQIRGVISLRTFKEATT